MMKFTNEPGREIFTCFYQSPAGMLEITASETALHKIDFTNKKKPIDKPHTCFKKVISQLDKYFAGKLKEFDLTLYLDGTPFQNSVWMMLTKILYGELATYGEIAKKINSPKAFRAVGMANNKNRIPIIIPCHRIVGSNQCLVGYGGGLKTKVKLLELEGFKVESPISQNSKIKKV